MIPLNVTLERFPWCEMMELVVVKEDEVVMRLGESEGVGWEVERRLETCFGRRKG